ncbi:MAG: AAA family ATPase [Clostridia bacterium]|nr:AAA family ATPase [Clostridia bacterium]
MGKVIAFANQKGGVGKTTSAVNVAAALGYIGKAVLLIDCDPQGNSTSGVGIRKKDVRMTTYDAVIGRAKPSECIIATKYKNLSVMPATMSLAGAEFELVDEEGREARLKNVCDEVKTCFDYIIIDCPPSLGILTVNSLVAANGVIIPMQCEYYSLEGLSQLMMSIRRVKQSFNPELEITGLILTMFNGRLNLTMQVVEELKKYYANKLFSTPVCRSVRLTEAPGFGQPIIYYDRYCKGSLEYLKIAQELTERI